MEFTVASADGFMLEVRSDVRWRRRSLRQHDPESAAASYVIDKVTGLAGAFSVLAVVALERRANAHLGYAANVKGLGVHVSWARVQIDADARFQREAQASMQLLSQAKAALEDRRLRISQAVSLRDLLREDPTLAVAHLLLEAPGKIDSHEITETVKEIAEYIAAFAPGATWVKTAQLLEESFSEMPPDARHAIINRVSKTLMEFGEKEAAQRLIEAHTPNNHDSTPTGEPSSTLKSHNL